MDMQNQRVWMLICCIGYLAHAAARTSPAATSAPTRFLNVTVVQNAPDIMKDEKGDYVGFLPDLMVELGQRLGFSYDFYEPPDKRFGRQDKAGNWDGMMGELINGNADLAGFLTVTVQRTKYVDFSKPVRSGDPAIVLKRPQKYKLSPEESLTRLLLPLEFSVWLMTVLAFLVTSSILYIISHTNPYEWRRMAKDKEATLREAESFTCLNSFWFIISTLAWQGYVRAPRSMGGRIVVTAWWFFVLLFILSYTASLTNLLRVGPYNRESAGYEEAITSFEDLANADNVMVGMIHGGATYQTFQKSKNPSLVEISKKVLSWEKEHNRTVTNVDDGLNYIKSRKLPDFALVLETSAAKNVVNKDCELYMIKDSNSNTRFVSFAAQKSTKVLNEINNGLLELYEDGTISMLDRKWYMSNKNCPKFVVDSKTEKPLVAPFHALDLGTFSGALLILVSGLVLGGFVTLVEICIFKWAENHPDEDEDVPFDQNGVSAADTLIPPNTKKGGATPV